MIISGGELARKAGVSKQRISALTKQGKLRRVEEGGRLGYDESDPAVRYYIDHPSSMRQTSGGARAEKEEAASTNSTDQATPGQVSPPIPPASVSLGQPVGGNLVKTGRRGRGSALSPDSSNYQARKDKGMAERYELDNRIKRHEYIPIADARRVFAKIYATHTGILCPLDAKLADQLAAEFGVSDPAKTLKGQGILHDEIFQALSKIKREIDDFLKAESERVITESEELALEDD
jgi:hypothetical protein